MKYSIDLIIDSDIDRIDDFRNGIEEFLDDGGFFVEFIEVRELEHTPPESRKEGLNV